MLLYGTLAIGQALVINASNYYLFFIPILWSHFICFSCVEENKICVEKTDIKGFV